MPSTSLKSEIERRIPSRKSLKVLEAGGGSRTNLTYDADAHITVIDISPEQLERNAFAHEKICADLETYDFQDRRYDVISCWDVVEHLDNPGVAVDNLLGALEEGGVMVIAAPLVNSAKGIVTKYTPHALHVWAYRYILGSKNAGKPGFAPFPTCLRTDIDPNRLIERAARHGKKVDLLHTYESAHVRKLYEKSRILFGAYKLFAFSLAIVSANRIAADATDFVLVLRNGNDG